MNTTYEEIKSAIEVALAMASQAQRFTHSTYHVGLKVKGKATAANKSATVAVKDADKTNPIVNYSIKPVSGVANTSSAQGMNRTPEIASTLYILYDMYCAPHCRDTFDKVGSGSLDVDVHGWQTTSDEKTNAQEMLLITFEQCAIHSHITCGNYGLATLLYDGYKGTLNVLDTKGGSVGKLAIGDQTSNK